MNKKHKLTLLSSALIVMLMLSGCVRRTSSGKPYGWVYDNLALPMQHGLEWLANHMGNSIGLAIIAITIIVRLVLMPLMLNQTKNSTIQQEKISAIRPQMQKIQEQQKLATTPEQRAQVNQAMMKLYKDNNISMTGGVGCLPLLIQWPIFAALYAAVQYLPHSYLAAHPFMGMNLGQKNFILVLLTFVLYAIQGWLSTLGVPEDQRKQMQSMIIVSPIMMGFMAMISPAALGLYFVAGGIIMIFQQFIVNAMRPKIRAQIEEEMKKNPTKVVDLDFKVHDDNKSKKKLSAKSIHDENRRRNAGKQQRNRR